MNKKLREEIKNLKKKDGQLWHLQQETRRLSAEYQLSVFARIRFIRIVNKAYRQGMEYGYMAKMKDELQKKEYAALRQPLVSGELCSCTGIIEIEKVDGVVWCKKCRKKFLAA